MKPYEDWRICDQVSKKACDVAYLEGFEPPTYCLEGSCSIQLSYRYIAGADDGNRTHVTSLEGWNSTIELHPHNYGL